MSNQYVWETFDALFRTIHRQGRRIEEMETRITALERRLAERLITDKTGEAPPQEIAPAPSTPCGAHEQGMMHIGTAYHECKLERGHLGAHVCGCEYEFESAPEAAELSPAATRIRDFNQCKWIAPGLDGMRCTLPAGHAGSHLSVG